MLVMKVVYFIIFKTCGCILVDAFKVFSICSDTNLCIPDIGNFCFLSFPWLVRIELYQFVDLFKEIAFGFIDFSLLLYCYQFHYLCSYIIFYHFLALHLILSLSLWLYIYIYNANGILIWNFSYFLM